jgi:type II secretory pathway pseudopilin PulG
LRSCIGAQLRGVLVPFVFSSNTKGFEMSGYRQYVHQNRKNRHALTLLELVVVLVILVALAGILVPLLPGMLGRTHTATGATNIAEINKLFLTHYAMEMGYPDGLDNLVDDGATTVFSKLPGNGLDPAIFSVTGLETAEADALIKAGITQVYNLDNNTLSPTFEPYPSDPPIPVAVAANLNVVRVDTVHVAEALDADEGTAKYVVFGLGKASPITGGGGMMLEAPVHFGEHGESTPDKVYSRFGVVFQLRNAAGEIVSPAKFVGAVAFHDNGIAGAGQAIEEFHEGHKH